MCNLSSKQPYFSGSYVVLGCLSSAAPEGEIRPLCAFTDLHLIFSNIADNSLTRESI